MQSAPALTGWSGFPSSLTTRPSRLRATTPHPAGHSRHTVANQDATPGTSCSFGTTSGRIVSLACWQPPVAAAAPDTVTILKKSRRFIYRGLQPGSNRRWRVIDTGGSARPIPAQFDERWRVTDIGGSARPIPARVDERWRSMMAGHAVERGVPRGFCVLLAVAFDAPAHRQGRRRGLEAREVQQVDCQARAGLGREGRHGLDGSVTPLALEARADVRLVRKVRELRQLVHADPGDRLFLRVILGDLLDLRLVGAGDLVTSHATLDRWKSRVLGAPRVAVTILAVDLVGADVDVVRKIDGLDRGLRGGGRLAAPRRNRQEDQNGQECRAECAYSRLAHHRQSIALRRLCRLLVNAIT